MVKEFYVPGTELVVKNATLEQDVPEGTKGIVVDVDEVTNIIACYVEEQNRVIGLLPGRDLFVRA